MDRIYPCTDSPAISLNVPGTPELAFRSGAALNRAAIRLIEHAPVPVLTITADNGTEFHGYVDLEAATGVQF